MDDFTKYHYLTKKQERMLVQMSVQGMLTGLADDYSPRAGNALVKMGYAEKIAIGVYKITPLGRERCQSIY